MGSDFILLAVLVRCGLLARLLRRLLRRAHHQHLQQSFAEPLPEVYPYHARTTLLSRAELAFYVVLREAVRDVYLVMPKIRLADVINCTREVWSLGYGRLIAQKHLDFVLVHPQTTRIVLAIELDDRSHAQASRQACDAFVDQALAAVGLPLVRVAAATAYEVHQVRRIIGLR